MKYALKTIFLLVLGKLQTGLSSDLGIWDIVGSLVLISTVYGYSISIYIINVEKHIVKYFCWKP